METGNLKYPYFVGPLIEEYRKLDPDSPEAIKLRKLIAVNIGDATTVCLILGVDSNELITLYPGMGKPVSSTMETIDSFLDKFGGKADMMPGVYIPEGYSEEERPDLQEEESSDSQEDGMNVSPAKETPKDKSFTLLQSLLKEQRYEEALGIIEAQNLINTEKNIYFADQIRFIKKLIKIKNNKNKPQG